MIRFSAGSARSALRLLGWRFGGETMMVTGRVRWCTVAVPVLVAVLASCSSGAGTPGEARGCDSWPLCSPESRTPLPGDTAGVFPEATLPSSVSTVTAAPMPTARATWQDPWLGRADVSVFLCGASDVRERGCVDGPVTAARREAVGATLRSLPETREVFHESPREAHEAFMRVSPENAQTVRPQDMPESFRVKLRDPSRFSDDLAALSGTPGIAMIVAIKAR